jgi:membrane protein
MAESQLSTEQQLSSIWRLGGLKPRQLVKNVWSEIDHDNVLGRSSELAYNFLLAVFPLLLCVLALLGIFASAGGQLRDALFSSLSTALPGSAAQLIAKTVKEVTTNSGGGKLTFGLVFALWAASGGMTTMISTLNGAYHVRESRSWVKVRAIALGLTVAVALLVVAALGIVLVGGHAAEAAGSRLALGSATVLIWKILQWPLALFFVTLSFSLIYYYGPDLKEQHWYWVTPGSIIGVVLWLVASLVFRGYLHFFNTYSKTYGSLGAVIILVVWFYVTGLAFMVGGEMNAEIEHAAARRGHPEAKEEGQKAA